MLPQSHRKRYLDKGKHLGKKYLLHFDDRNNFCLYKLLMYHQNQISLILYIFQFIRNDGRKDSQSNALLGTEDDIPPSERMSIKKIVAN